MKQVKYITVVLLMLAGSLVNAQQGRQGHHNHRGQFEQQGHPEMRQKILEKKIAYFKENLMLNQQESIAFEKTYREYEAQREALHKKFKDEVLQKIKRGKANDLSQKEQMAIIDRKLAIDEEKYQLKRNFTVKLTQIMPPVKVIRYFKLEREFKKKMMKQLKRQRKNKKGRMGMRGGKQKDRRM